MKVEQEPKYIAIGDNGREGKLYNRASGELIPDDEPVFVFRARDKHAWIALQIYSDHCLDEAHQRSVRQRVTDFRQFADMHQDRMKEPDTETSQNSIEKGGDAK